MGYNRDKKYTDEVYERFHSGGILWFFERTDTNEFQTLHLGIRSSNEPDIPDYWSKPLGIWHLHKAYLTKEDAESEFRPHYEGGCYHCGNGAIEIPVKIIEHEFVQQQST